MWVSVCFLLSRVGGWSELAARYPAPDGVTGTNFHWRSGRVGWVNYRNCLNLTATPAGLKLSVVAIFKMGHAPILVPWSAIRAEREKSFFISFVRLTFVGSATTLDLYAPLAEDLIRAGGGQVRYPPDR